MKRHPWLLAAPGSLAEGETVVLDPTETRHLAGSLRRSTGEDIVLVDGAGCTAEARIVTIRRDRSEVEILSVHRHKRPQSNGVTVALAVVSSRHMDWAVQKSVEIGIRRFLPMVTDRAQIRRRDAAKRSDHWRRISMQALKQCRRAWAMEIGDPESFADIVDSQEEAGVVADREGCSIGQLPDHAGSFLLVGPEGGFSVDESEVLDRHGWLRLCLGPHVLRADTAAVVGGAMLVARAGE